MSMDPANIPSESGLNEKRLSSTVTPEWDPVSPPPIEGVEVRDVKNLITKGGTLTELFRPEWFDPEFDVQHVVHVTAMPGYTSQWHCHHLQRDIVFPVRGYVRIGLYDARVDSPTRGNSFVATFHIARPRYVIIPRGVWHALRNVGHDEAAYVVLNDLPFNYETPDDWVLPAGAEAIPVRLD